jgi:hypothetical protein
MGITYAQLRQCFVGAIPMEDMDLVVRPMTRDVTVNPVSPDIPSAVAKGLRLFP